MSGTDREIRLLIKADGSIAAKEIEKLRTGTESLAKAVDYSSKAAGPAAAAFHNYRYKIGEAAKASKEWREELKDLSKAWSGYFTEVNQGLEILGKVKTGFETLVDVANSSAKVNEARDSFARYAASVGKSSEKIIDSLRTASGGTISEMGLITTASKAMSLGVTTDADKMGNLLLIARNKARLFGIDTAEAFDNIVTGIGRGSPLILDNLGIRIPAGFEEMTKGMTEADKTARLFELTLAEGNKQLDAMGGVLDSGADKFRQMKVVMEEMKVAIGDELSPVLQDLADIMENMVLPPMKMIISGWAKISSLPGVVGKGIGNFLGNATAGTSGSPNFLVPPPIDDKNPIAQAQHAVSWYQGLKDNPAYGLSDYSDVIDALLAKQKRELNRLYEGAKNDRNELKAKAKAEFVDFFQGQYRAALESPIGNFFEKFYAEGGVARAKSGSGRSSRRAEKEFESLFSAMGTAYTQGKSGGGLEATMKAIETVAESLGADKVPAIRDVMLEAARAAGDFAGNLETAAGTAENRLAKSLADAKTAITGLLGERYATGLGSAAKNLLFPEQKPMAEEFFGGAENFVKTFYDALSQKSGERESAMSSVRDDLSINVRGAFESGVYDFLSGNGFDSFGKSLANQAKRALSASITSAIFDGGGLAGSIGIGGSSSSSGGGITSGLMKPIFHSKAAGGGLNWAGLGTNLAIGAAASWLTSPGRLFGGTVVHGQEVQGQAADINSRVVQAQQSRDQILQTAVGLSKETAQLLRDLRFSTASVSWEKSGDGLFSKKTKTYSLDSSAANASLEAFEKASKEAAIEVARRTFDIGIAQIDSPFRALEMTLSDLQSAIERTTDEEGKYSLKLQAAQIQAQKSSFWAENLSDWTGFATSNPAAGIGGSKPLTYSLLSQVIPGMMANVIAGGGMEGAGGGMTRSTVTQAFNPMDFAKYRISGGFWQPNATYQVGEKKMSAEEFESWAGKQIMAQGIKNQSAMDFNIASQLAGGKNLWDVQLLAGSAPEMERYQESDMIKYREKPGTGSKPYMYGDYLKDQVSMYDEMMKSLETRLADSTLSTEKQAQLFEQFQQANTSYWDAKQKMLDLEAQQAEEVKRKEAERRDSTMGSLLSFVGEVGGRNGNTYNIFGAQQTLDLLQKLRSAANGANPDFISLLDGLIQAGTDKARWGTA
jgi:hypothetical protein